MNANYIRKDLARFIKIVIAEPAFVTGNSSIHQEDCQLQNLAPELQASFQVYLIGLHLLFLPQYSD
jgi:hypothetical protein